MSAVRIGVSGVTRKYDGAERAAVNAAYVKAVIRAGGVPIILSPLIDPAHAGLLLDAVDGLLLTGGEDVEPSHFGEAPHPGLQAVDPARDALELALFREARARAVPVLAICRGIQLVNVALGGTLWQDLPSQRPGPIRHDQTGERVERSHDIHVTPGSQLAELLGTVRLKANSFHHQAIRDVAPGLIVTATAEDGVIEGVEGASGAPWLVAIQWHPEEFHGEVNAPEQGLFAAFVREADGAVSRKP